MSQTESGRYIIKHECRIWWEIVKYFLAMTYRNPQSKPQSKTDLSVNYFNEDPQRCRPPYHCATSRPTHMPKSSSYIYSNNLPLGRMIR